MKLSRSLIAVLLILGSILIVPQVAASTNCSATLNVCHGWAQVSTTTGGVSSTRCFSWYTVNSAPACSTTTSQQAWTMDAGACITLYYFDTTTGAVPPSVPNKVTLQIRHDNTATVIRTVLNAGAEPVNGASTSICATDTGVSGGNARAGTYRIFLNPVKDNGAGGVGNYNINSDGTASVGAISQFDAGALRGDIVCISVVRSAYPADNTFAYGTAADEQVTVTSTFTQPNGNNGREKLGDGVNAADLSSWFVSGASTAVGGTTSLIQSFTINNVMTTTTANPFVQITSTATLTAEFWTHFSTTGNGAGLTIIANGAGEPRTFCYDGSFNVDPRIVSDSDGVGTFATADDIAETRLTSSSGTVTNLFNRGETAYLALYIFNARGEKLSRAMTFEVLDASNTVCVSFGSVTPTANKYSGTHIVPIGGSCTVVNTVTGSPRYLRITNTAQTHTTLAYDFVSSLYFIDSHIQISATLNKDNYPTENANEDTTYIISVAQTDTTHGWCHVVSVRKDLDIDTSGSVITWSYIDPLSTTRLTGTTDTASDGWTATHLDLLASTPLGTWTFRCAIASGAPFNGNYGTNDQTFTVTVPSGTGTGFPGDPLRLLCSPIIANPGETLDCVASENNNDGSIRTGNAGHTFFDLYGPAHTAIVTGAAATEIGTSGQYYYNRAWGASPTLGSYIVIVRTDDTAIIASSTEIYVETDPTLALSTATQVSNSQTTVTNAITNSQTTITGAITNSQTTITGAITNSQTTITGVIAGVATQVNEIDVDADEILAGQVLQATSTQITTLQTNNTDYHNHLNSHEHEIATDVDTIITDIANLQTIDQNEHQQILNALAGVNMTVNATINQTVNNHLSFSPYLLILAAIAFFAIAAETKKDLLYWVMCLVLSIVLIFVRPSDSTVPVEFFVGWIFIVLYQIIVLFMANRSLLNPAEE